MYIVLVGFGLGIWHVVEARGGKNAKARGGSTYGLRVA